MVSRLENGVGPDAKGNNHHSSHNSREPENVVARLVWKAFAFSFGFANWLMFLFLAVRRGSYFQKPSEKEQNQFAIARDKYWNLSKQPVPGFNHEFFKAQDGFQFHYICNQRQPLSGKDLFIFIHGFPNTCMTWRFLFQESALPTSDATLVAVDLPGCGGSDSLERYDTRILEYLVEFIAGMRERYGTSGDSVGSTFVIGHDWGCVISMRLAAEAPSIADRFILFNGPLPDLAKANFQRSFNSARQIFRQFQASPRKNFGCLSKSFQALKPLLRQLSFSGYIFVFQLPAFFVKPLGQGGNLSFLRACYKAEHGPSRDEYNRWDSSAANLAPSLAECKTETKSGTQYGSTVAQRVHSIGEIFWHITAYYRFNLTFSQWDKSIETTATLYNMDSDLSSSDSPARRRSSSAASSLFNDVARGSLRAPATVLWGESDIALTRPICLDGIADYLGRDSEAILFPDFGHWLQVDKASRKVLAHVIALFASGDSRSTPSYVADEVRKLDVKATLLVKR